MNGELLHPLDAEALACFARKGHEGGPRIPQAGPANGVKVRRIMQITRDLARRPFEELRILDLGCGDGVYAIEAGLRGAKVVALDARNERMNEGAACARRHGLGNGRFVEADVRHLRRQACGSFDVVFLLGLLYHLDAPDVFAVLEDVVGVCGHLLVVDTLISMTPESHAAWRGQTYDGQRVREHEDTDSDEVRRSRVLKSIDNTFSFRFTREALLRVLRAVGFTSVYPCAVPFEPGKADDRLTLAAVKGKPVVLSAYPWVNDKSEEEIAEILRDDAGSKP
jgi:SAM-dependent methyltransferase